MAQKYVFRVICMVTFGPTAEKIFIPQLFALQFETQASFDSFEKKGWKIRIKGIRDYMSVFGEKPEKVNYELQYGRVSGKA